MSGVIRLSDLGKRYALPDATRPDSIKGAFLSGWRSLRSPRHLWAVRNVDLEVEPGATLGLIGPNGAGKTTLLQLVAGIERPDEGRVEVDGRVGALLELGAGFHPELTARESAISTAIIAGLTRAEAMARLPDIVEFSELEEAMDRPVRTLSTGMRARLAFAIAVHVDPEILLIDEILSVGDLSFQHRSLERIRRFQQDGVTLLVVSHDPGLVADLCQDVAWIESGRVVSVGPVEEILERYRRAVENGDAPETPDDLEVQTTAQGVELRAGDNRVGDQAAVIDRVWLRDGWGREVHRIENGAALSVSVRVVGASGPIRAQVRIERPDDLVCVDTSTLVTAQDGRSEIATAELARLDLSPGRYLVSVGLYSEDWLTTHDFHSQAYPLEITQKGTTSHRAILSPPVAWRISDPA